MKKIILFLIVIAIIAIGVFLYNGSQIMTNESDFIDRLKKETRIEQDMEVSVVDILIKNDTAVIWLVDGNNTPYAMRCYIEDENKYKFWEMENLSRHRDNVYGTWGLMTSYFINDENCAFIEIQEHNTDEKTDIFIEDMPYIFNLEEIAYTDFGFSFLDKEKNKLYE